MKRLPTMEHVVDRLVTARHPNFRPVEWRPVEEAYQFWSPGEVPRIRLISRDVVPLSDKYPRDPDARQNLPNTWRYIAAVSVRAAALQNLRNRVGETSLSLYRLLPGCRLEMGDVQDGDIIEARGVESSAVRVHGLRIGLTGGQYGIGVSSEGALFTLPTGSITSYGPFTIQSLEQDTSTFTGMRFS